MQSFCGGTCDSGICKKKTIYLKLKRKDLKCPQCGVCSEKGEIYSSILEMIQCHG